MTDNEIINALECCKEEGACCGCPYHRKEDCIEYMAQDALDLINRQKAEIESKNDLIHRQSDVISEQKEKLERIYAEAVKEFAERLKLQAYTECSITGYKYQVVQIEDIDNLVKEMVGDAK